MGLTLIFIVGAGSVSAGWFGDDSTGEELSATTDYNFTYFGSENPAPKDGYDFAIQTDDGVFYIDNSLASKLSEYSSNFGIIYNAALTEEYENNKPEYEGSVGYIYPIKVYNTNNEGTGAVTFDFPNDKNFTFEYKIGTVGANDQAKIMTKIYDDTGTEL